MAVVEKLQERVLFSALPALFYVRANGNDGAFYPAHTVNGPNGSPIVDPGTLQPSKHLYATNSANSAVLSNPMHYMIFPYSYSISSATTNANRYNIYLPSVLGNLGLSQFKSDFQRGGAQDLQKPPGTNDFVRAFTDAGYYNFGFQGYTAGIPQWLLDHEARLAAANSYENAVKNGTQDDIDASPPGQSLTDQGWNDAQKFNSAIQGSTNGSLTIEGSSADPTSINVCSLRPDGTLQIITQLTSGETETFEQYSVDYSVLTVTVPTDGSQVVLTGVAPGDNITVQVEYSTTDENENGEGESLTIATTGGDSMSDASYNATSVYNFTATQPNEALSATPDGWDGDESATVNVTVSSSDGSGISPAQGNALSTSSSDLDTESTGAATVANALDGGSASYDAGAADAAWTTSALQADASNDFSDLAGDPIDTNYKVTVRPGKTTSVIFSEAKNFHGLKNAGALASSINALDLNQEKSINVAAAAYVTSNKLDGAVAAGNAVWTKRQTATLKSYLKELAVLLKSQPLLSNREAVQLNKSGLGSTTVASTDVNNFEETVNDDGLPTQLVTDLNALGVSSATQSQIQQALFAQDIDTASGTYSSILTNSSLEAELTQVAALLKAG